MLVLQFACDPCDSKGFRHIFIPFSNSNVVERAKRAKRAKPLSTMDKFEIVKKIL